MRILQNVSEDFWWKVATECQYATFFHTPLWHKLARNVNPTLSSHAVGAELESGARIILPIVGFSIGVKGRFKHLSSTYAGCYGGIIATETISIKEQNRFYRLFMDWRIGKLVILQNPLAKNIDGPEGFKRLEDFTQILTLESDFDMVFSKFSKGHRYNARKGHKLGVIVRQADSLNDYRAYYAAYHQSLLRWGDRATSSYPWAFFEEGYKLSKVFPDQIRLWVAELNNEIIAGAWIFYWNNHVVYWHGTSLADYFQYYPANVLLTKIIKSACHEGFKLFDFNPSGGHEGVSRFKEHFGSEKMPLTQWKYTNSLFSTIDRIYRRANEYYRTEKKSDV